jgi:hypothetical protein
MRRCKLYVTVRRKVNIAEYFRRLLRPHFPLSNNISQIKITLYKITVTQNLKPLHQELCLLLAKFPPHIFTFP